MKKSLSIILILTTIILLTSCKSSKIDVLDLSGKWTVKIDSTDVGEKEGWTNQLFKTNIMLPGTLDDAGLGKANTLESSLSKPQILHLTRQNNYVGAAWYSKKISIPANWKEKDMILMLERVLWDSQVWVDGKKVEGHEESLISPHIYNLTTYLSRGHSHILTIRIDNRKRYDISVKDLAHAYTNETQIMWNGVLGKMYIKAVDKSYIDYVEIYPNVDEKRLKAVVHINNDSKDSYKAHLSIKLSEKDGEKIYNTTEKEILIKPGKSTIDLDCLMYEDMKMWSEFSPTLFTAVVKMVANDMISENKTDFGMRSLTTDGNKLILNGKPLFLRGTLESCIFPLTGTPPMTKLGWEKVFKTAKEYGLNHLRFHSWCPPEAAFEKADEMGFYLQIELPVWTLTIGQDPQTIDFLKKEADRIIKYYGNHPSFCLWSMGNELQGDFSVLSNIVDELKSKDARHLYTTTTFTFEKGHGVWPENNDDYFVTQWTKKGWVRGQGVFNKLKPSFDKDYTKSVEGMKVPLITHEVGQYSVYPDLSEIPKYTGILKPLNFIGVKKDLEKKGLLDQASNYLKASGALAKILYKEEIERALKTDGISGFQLLDLHDYPGQGTALVGLLNAFWDSKGIVTGKEFREFCSPVVPLLRFPKAVYTNNETFEAEVEICNYGAQKLENKSIKWSLLSNNIPIKQGVIKNLSLDFGYNGNIGEIHIPLNNISSASKLVIKLNVAGTSYQNQWNIWVYPNSKKVNFGNVKYTRDYTTAKTLLSKGEKVLFNPDWKTMIGLEGKFVPVFWSPVHFPKQAGTMGILCNPENKALAYFPTDMHSDWQWWDLNIHSTAMVVDSIKGGSPIVSIIDNFVNNRRLASLYEGQVGEGKLILATFDLKNNLDKRPVARQMLKSLLNYMNSEYFNPSGLLNFEKLETMFLSGHNEKQSAKSIY